MLNLQSVLYYVPKDFGFYLTTTESLFYPTFLFCHVCWSCVTRTQTRSIIHTEIVLGETSLEIIIHIEEMNIIFNRYGNVRIGIAREMNFTKKVVYNVYSFDEH